MAASSSSTSSTSVEDSSVVKQQEINVFRIPHSRMKELVELHIRKVAKIENFSSSQVDIDMILQAVYQAMWELKSHEYIENHYIMDRLKARLQARQIYNQLVCNCHEDSKLLGVIRLVEKVYSANDKQERESSGRELRSAIQEFLNEFLHHMEEEEKVFQPLLTENFEERELRIMNEIVLKQHSLFRQKVQTEKSLTAIKRKHDTDGLDEFEFSIEDLRFRKSYCEEVEEQRKKRDFSSSSSSNPPVTKKVKKMPPRVPNQINDGITSETSIEHLPYEIICNHIFIYLSPKDLLRSSQVCSEWRSLAYAGLHWRDLLPIRWARGQWDGGIRPKESFSQTILNENFKYGPSESHERQIIEGTINYLLPKVGRYVKQIEMSHSSVLGNSHINQILMACPNVEYLDLSYTPLDERAFLRLPESHGLSKLTHLDLSGCDNVNDDLIALLSNCYSRNEPSKLSRLSLSGCREVTSFGIAMLEVHQKSLDEVDLSGCYMVDGETLCSLVYGCPKLKAERLSYCSDIEDGPYNKDANGCWNLECSIRFCCRQLKN